MFICQESNNYPPDPLAATAISDPPSGLKAVAQGRSTCHIQSWGSLTKEQGRDEAGLNVRVVGLCVSSVGKEPG